MTAPLHWAVFCRVIDNFGDIGVGWRLAADLAQRGDTVRLIVDDARALRWMAPDGARGVTVQPWSGRHALAADVVVALFGCTLPDHVVAQMAARPNPPLWLNVEHLSAEPVVDRLHKLPSPQLAGPGKGLSTTFFYPGFTAATGGLLREPALLQRCQRFDAAAWRTAQRIDLRPGERCVSLFCYPHAPVWALLNALADQPTLLLATDGHAAQQVRELMGPHLARGAVRAQVLPLLSQHDFDHLLWACDLNVVRGEDSIVRAQWAAKPFLWHIYPQHDDAHADKLAAFSSRFLADAPVLLASALAKTLAVFNAIGQVASSAPPPLGLPPLTHWQKHCAHWRDRLTELPDLTSQLRAFVGEAR